ncbi:MAG: hypothetical protein V4691_08600 [Pseudomonadota bacterium]
MVRTGISFWTTAGFAAASFAFFSASNFCFSAAAACTFIIFLMESAETVFVAAFGAVFTAATGFFFSSTFLTSFLATGFLIGAFARTGEALRFVDAAGREGAFRALLVLRAAGAARAADLGFCCDLLREFVVFLFFAVFALAIEVILLALRQHQMPAGVQEVIDGIE